MAENVANELITRQIFPILQETFEKVEGIYLDRGTSLCETLDTLSAAEASRPTTPGGTSIAGHVEHIRFYLRVMNDYMDGKFYEKLDWKQSWLVHTVSEQEWTELRQRVRDDYRGLLAHLQSFPDWNDERRLGGVIAVVAHTAFHIGAIRQMVKVVRG
ncbi:MAG: DinB family protein [Candidatus Zixiibacteriota bacterium]